MPQPLTTTIVKGEPANGNLPIIHADHQLYCIAEVKSSPLKSESSTIVPLGIRAIGTRKFLVLSPIVHNEVFNIYIYISNKKKVNLTYEAYSAICSPSIDILKNVDNRLRKDVF